MKNSKPGFFPPRRYFWFLAIRVLLPLAILQVSRLLHFAAYPDFWSGIGWAERLLGMLQATRFDLSVVAKTTLLLEVFYLLLGPIGRSKAGHYLFCAVSGFFLMALIHIQLFSIFIFQLAGRHVVFEYSEWFRHFGSVLREAVFTHGLIFLPASLMLLAVVYLWFRLWRRFVDMEGFKYLGGVVMGLALLIGGVVLARGGFQTKPIQENFAIDGNEPRQLGYLRLNSVFTLINYYANKQVKAYELMPEELALELAREATDTERMKSADPAYPFLKQFSSNKAVGEKPNFVFLIMESWNAKMMASLTPQSVRLEHIANESANSAETMALIQGLPEDHPLKTGLTPNFDRLAKDGLLFTNFFANGTNSIEGLTSIVTSLPPMKDFDIANSGFVQNRFKTLNGILGELGYYGLYLSGLFDGSGNNDKLLALAGIDRIVEKSKFEDAQENSDVWGIYDHLSLERLNTELAEIPKPFFAYYISVSTHTPYDLPQGYEGLLPPEVPMHEYLNELHYSDAAIGAFIEAEKLQLHFNNTIYFITADHTSYINPEDIANYERIPLLVYAPGRIMPGVEEKLGSHADFLPTVADMAGYKGKFTTTGSSLMDSTGRGKIYTLTGSDFRWIQDGFITYLRRDFQDPRMLRLDTGVPDRDTQSELDKFVATLKGFYQASNNSIVNNSLMPVGQP